ncbi:ATP-binding protein, partial [Streptomyces sp. NPDC002920]
DEHQQAILLSVRHEASFDGGTPSTDGYRQTQRAVDAQVKKVVDAFGGRLPDTEAQALREVEGLTGLRETIEQGYLPADNIDPAYTGASKALIDGLGLDRNSSLASTFTGNLLDSLLRADAAHGAYETGVFSARTGDSNALIEFTGAVGSYELFTYQAERFDRFASDAQSERLGGIEHNTSQAAISQYYAELAVDPSALQADSQADIRAAFREALDSYPDFSAQAKTRLKITTSLIDQIADRADDAARSAQWRAVLLLSLALFCFTMWITFAVLVRRSVVRPVLALTGAAQEVADIAGRELARVADDDAEESGSPRLRELPVTADDEIGELAEAFNNVQTTAAALLERQVLSRRNVAEMFGNVGRRVSNLTTRQLALIDAVERGETDPALLARLYSIDHIAVRLRRNADSLMLLAGIRETVLDSGPTELTNVVRAALGQIEGFQRVRLHAGTETMIEPDIIGDLTLMIAELLENAVSFSPEGSPVEVRVGSDPDGASITVSDHGLGMSAERLTEENARLVRRERLDLVPTKVLGLFVVGALARRWRIDVTLSRTPGGGVTSEVRIPATLLLTLSGIGAASGAPHTAGGPLPAPSAPAAGPSRASSVPVGTAEDDASLPRRVPRRDQPSWAEPDEPAPVPAATADAVGAATGSGTGSETVSYDRTIVSASHDYSQDHSATPAGASADTGYGAAGSTANGDRAAAERSAHSRTPEPPTLPRRTGGAPQPPARTTPAPAPGAEAARPGTVQPGTAPSVPRTRVGETASGARAGGPAAVFASGDDGPRPLRRRVRGATLRTTVDASAQAARQPAKPADADEVRSELEEFEAAVRRAHLDTGEHPSPGDRPSAPYDRRERHDGNGGQQHDQYDGHDRHDGNDRRVPDDHRNPPHHQNHLPEGAEQ